MKAYRKMIVAGLMGMLAWGAGAQDAAQAPATLPAGHPPVQQQLPPGHPPLPAGHPEIGGAARPATRPAATLPAGHPALPAGHPPMGGMPGGATGMGAGQLPPGHPPMGGMTGGAPATLPSGHPGMGEGQGVLAIAVKQATKGGWSVAGRTAKVELYYRGQVLRTLEAKLDDRGVAMLQKLPLTLPFQPVVTLEHEGVTFRGVGDTMDAKRAAQRIDLTVFETTDERPAWRVQTRHVLVHPLPNGMLRVTDVLALENPSDKAWTGVAQADGERTVADVALPEGVESVQVAKEVVIDVKLAPGKLTIVAPLLPGMSRLQYTYDLDPKGGQVKLPVVAPAETEQMMVFIPDDGTFVDVQGLKRAEGPADMNGARALMFAGKDFAPGAQVVLTLAAPKRASARLISPQAIAGVGGGAILVAGTGYIFLKGKATRKAS